jgi:protein O-mannosyl-transferase
MLEQLTATQPEASMPQTISLRPPHSGLFSRRELSLLLAFILVTVTLLLYAPSLRNGFINFDDSDYIAQNSRVLHGLSWNNLAWAFTTTFQGNWHPLTWLSLMATAQFFGPKPLGFHLVNLLLHILNVVLLFFLLQKATGFLLRSVTVAALFAVLPLNVEAVVWASERKSVLSTTFLVLALLAYGWYARKPAVGRYLGMMALFILSLLAKSMMVTLPFALLLVDYWPLERAGTSPGDGKRWLKLGMEKIPLLVIALADTVMAIYAGHRGGALDAYNGNAPLGLRAENALWSYIAYIVKGIWPSHLAIIYPFPRHGLPGSKIITAGLLLLAITAAVWRWREKRYLLSGWLWFLGTLVPVIGIIQTGPQSIADRWAYVSFLGLFVIIVWLAADCAAQIALPHAALVVPTLAILCGYAWVSHVQIGYWRSSYTVFSHALAVTTGNGYAENNLGIALEYEMGRPELAVQHYQAATALTPELPTAHYNFGTALEDEDRLDEAQREYELAIKYSWNGNQSAQAHNNLGTLFVKRNEPAAAFREFSAAIRSDPAYDYSYLNRAMLEYRERNLDAAQQDIERATQLMPTAGTYFWLGRVFEERGDLQSAAAAYRDALRINPGFNQASARLNALQQKLR